MKRTLLTMVLVLLGTLVFSQERIAVFPFEDMDNILTKNESVLFYRQFSNEFTNKNAGRFTIVPRQDVEKLFNAEEKFQLSDLSAKAKTAETQRVLNGTQILSGIIGKKGNVIRVSVSLYTFPELSQLKGGVDFDVANVDVLFDKIPELVLSMQNNIAGGEAISQSQTSLLDNFIRVEGGTFQMGSINGENHERPVHTVTVKSFSISKYEVTQKEWYEIMGTTIRQQRDMADKSLSIYGEGDNYPMYYVNWYEVVEYCNRRSIKEGLTPAYRSTGDNIICDWNANGYRLPTEAEWEFAAKGGTKEYITTEYSGSNSVGAVAWYESNSNNSTHPVGTKAANNLGIYDMSGNVWEWCWDWYGDYTSSSQTDPRGAVSGTLRVLRGGGWGSSAAYIRSACRYIIRAPSYRGYFIGFRLVRS
jgi:Uncharacterized conserved protein